MTSHSRSDASPAARLPEQGHRCLSEFSLAPELIHLNHGSYGAVPRTVQAEQHRLREEIERDPTGYFQYHYPGEVRRAVETAAARFGGAARDWVFCENATAAVNAVLASFPLKARDEIVTTSHAYGAVLKAMQLWAARRDAVVRIAEVPPAVESATQVVEAIAGAFTGRTRLLVVDHITSPTAIVFPISEIVQAARAAGVPVLVDGAHAPGQLEPDVPALGADWYTGNAHKWFFAPRGCGLLWTAPHRQELTRPAVLSHGTDRGYAESFDWIGTRDPTPWLSLPAAAAAYDRFGGDALMARNRRLAAEAAELVAGKVNGKLSAPASMRAAMASICLPNRAHAAEDAQRLRAELHKAGFVVPVNSFAGSLWLRLSAQIYNELADYQACAGTLLKYLAMAPRSATPVKAETARGH
jgi:isopenicillin-N epimerase